MKTTIQEKNKTISNLGGKESDFTLRIDSLNNEDSLLKDQMAQVDIEVNV